MTAYDGGKIDACPDENVFALLGQDAVDAATRAALEAHVDRCAACDLLLRELGALEAADAMPVPPRYRIVRRLGAGGMGDVWAAEDRELHRPVALKLVRAGRGDVVGRARLLREARLCATVRHPNVVTVYDVGEHADQLYVAMELVDGASARDWRAAGERSAAEILAVWRAAAAGLSALHAAGVVHRDVKPDNILVAGDGRVVVCDLGLATDRDVSATALTRTGQLVGTPAYMAPEQLHGEPAGERADQFAWCVAVWEALTGARPYTGDTIAAIALAMSAGPPRPAGEHAAVLAVLARGLAIDPGDRWSSLDELVAAVGAPRRRRRWPWALVAVAFAMSVVMWLAMRGGGGTAVATPDAAEPPMTIAPLDAAPAPVDAAPIARAATPDAAPDAKPPPTPPKPTAGSGSDITYVIAVAQKLHAAQAARDRRDGRGCLVILDGVGPIPASARQLIEHDYGIVLEDLRPPCEMLAGACAAGRDHLAARLRARGKPDDAIAIELDGADRAYCPFTAPGTVAQREARLLAELQLATGACDATVDAAESAGVLPSAFTMLDYQAAVCLARAGKCDRATAYIDRAPGMKSSFAAAFPRCAPP